MWKRKIKNQFGMVKESSGSDQPWYKAVEKEVNDAIPGVTYHIEYLRKENEDAFDRAGLRSSKVDPWEFFDEYDTDSLGLALKEIMLRLVDPNCVDTNIWMTSGESEVFAEIPLTLKFSLRQAVQADANSRIKELENQVDILKREAEMYRDFLGECHATETFKKWKAEQNK